MTHSAKSDGRSAALEPASASTPNDNGELRLSALLGKQRLPWVLAAIVVYAVALFVFFPLASQHPFAYDEADYMWAGKQGFWANYTDRNGLSFIDFVRKGLELYGSPEKRQEFSKFIRSSGDIGSYRHYHGPVYAYWLAFLHELGITREEVFRGSGLFIHMGTATLILFGFWAAFPRLPALAGLVACALFVFNRTALAAAMGITQHSAFTFVVIAALFAASLFFRRYENRWLYVLAAVLGACFATVETTAVLVVALVLALALDWRRAREKWSTPKSFGITMGKALGIFLLVLFLLWPKSLLQVAVAKGFLQLMYMAVARKTFTPGGPFDLWRSLFVASPGEFWVLLVGLIAAVVLWRRLPHRHEMLPWVVFAVLFVLITLKITIPFTYYFAPLTATAVVLTGIVFGALWQCFGTIPRVVVSGLVLWGIVATAMEWARVSAQIRNDRTYLTAVMDIMRQKSVQAGQQMYVPYQFVPTLHYYRPELETIGYDVGYPLPPIIAALRSSATANTMFCLQPVCDAVQRMAPELVTGRELVHGSGPTGTPVYLLQITKAAGR